MGHAPFGAGRARPSCPGAAPPPQEGAAARQCRERYLRRLGIGRCGAAGRGGQAPPTPRGRLSTRGLEIKLDPSAGFSSVKNEIVQEEDSIVDCSNEIEVSARKESNLGVSDVVNNSVFVMEGRIGAIGGGERALGNKPDMLMGGKSDKDHARMKFLQRLSYERVWVPKVQRPPAHQTVIIFDWDDTLICTSFLKEIGTPLPEGVLQQLRAIEKVSARLLEMAQCMGQTFIITNAVSGWVQSSARAWAPSLVPLLERVQVVSARSRYEAAYPRNAWKWKSAAFLEVRRRLNAQAVTNLVSLGDSEYEMEATKAMGRELERASVKLVKFSERPDPNEMLKQLKVVTDGFARILGSSRSQRFLMQKAPRP